MKSKKVVVLILIMIVCVLLVGCGVDSDGLLEKLNKIESQNSDTISSLQEQIEELQNELKDTKNKLNGNQNTELIIQLKEQIKELEAQMEDNQNIELINQLKEQIKELEIQLNLVNAPQEYLLGETIEIKYQGITYYIIKVFAEAHSTKYISSGYPCYNGDPHYCGHIEITNLGYALSIKEMESMLSVRAINNKNYQGPTQLHIYDGFTSPSITESNFRDFILLNGETEIFAFSVMSRNGFVASEMYLSLPGLPSYYPIATITNFYDGITPPLTK